MHNLIKRNVIIISISILLFACTTSENDGTTGTDPISEDTSTELSSGLKPSSKRKGKSGYFLKDTEIQEFTIHSDSDTILTGKNGVRLHVPSNSFMFEDDSKPVHGVVKIQLQEYLNAGDMMLAGMSTRMTNGGILQTGGMVYISAKSNEKPVILKGVHPIKIDFPVKEKVNEKMRLFTGNRNKDGIVEWQLPGKNRNMRKINIDTSQISIREYLPRCLHCFDILKRVLNRDYSQYFPKNESSFSIQLDIEPGGSISFTGIPDTIPSEIMQAILNALDSVQPLFPARANNIDVQYSANMTFQFIAHKGTTRLNISSSDITEYKKPILREMIQQQIYNVFIQLPDKTIQRWNPKLHIGNGEYEMKYKNDLFMQYGKLISVHTDSLIFQPSQNQINQVNNKYYRLLSFELGYINCDAFTSYPPATLKNLEISDKPQISTGYLYLPNRKAVLPATYISGKHHFTKIPTTENIIYIFYTPINNESPENGLWIYGTTRIDKNNWDNPIVPQDTITFENLIEKISAFK